MKKCTSDIQHVRVWLIPMHMQRLCFNPPRPNNPDGHVAYGNMISSKRP